MNQTERGCEKIYLWFIKNVALTCLGNIGTCFKLINFKISRGIPPSPFVFEGSLQFETLASLHVSFFHVVETGFFWRL